MLEQSRPPLIGGTTKFQPVFVDGMRTELLELLRRSETPGKTYEFGEPRVYSFKVLLDLLLAALNRRCVRIPSSLCIGRDPSGLLHSLAHLSKCCSLRKGRDADLHRPEGSSLFARHSKGAGAVKGAVSTTVAAPRGDRGVRIPPSLGIRFKCSR